MPRAASYDRRRRTTHGRMVAAVPGLQVMMTRLPMTRGMVKRAVRQFGLGRALDSGPSTSTRSAVPVAHSFTVAW